MTAAAVTHDPSTVSGASNNPAYDVSKTAYIANHLVTGLVLADSGGEEILHTVAASGASQTLNPSAGNVHDVTLTAACTITLGSTTSGKACAITIITRQDGTGGWAVTWPGSVSWLGGSAPSPATTPGVVQVYTLWTLDGGTSWGATLASSAAAPLAPTTAHAELTSDVNLTSTLADVLTLSLAAGTWVLFGKLMFQTAQASKALGVQVNDGTNVLDSTEFDVTSAGFLTAVPIQTEPFVLSGTTTIHVQCKTNDTGTTPMIVATTSYGGGTHKSSKIFAMKLA